MCFASMPMENIFNESIIYENPDLGTQTINEYNILYESSIKVIDSTVRRLPAIESEQQNPSETSLVNLGRINQIEQLIKEYLRLGNG